AIKDYNYPRPKQHSDSLLHMTVTSPVFRGARRGDDVMAETEAMYRAATRADDDEGSFKNENKLQGNKTTGENITETYMSVSKKAFEKASRKIWATRYARWNADSTMLVVKNNVYRQPNGFLVRELVLSDTGSSRQLLTKSFYRGGHFFHLATITDTIGRKSAF